MQPTRLKNKNCIYCSTEITRENRTDEHVIGRRFVPKGSLHNAWNLIAFSCFKCNERKSDLEDDIGAITLSQSVAIPISAQDAVAKKVAGSISRKTKKPVNQSNENFEFASEHAGISIKFGMTAPPQIAEDRWSELAYFHATALFYLITFNKTAQVGGYFPGTFVAITSASRSDWGNDTMRDFMTITRSWNGRLILETADSHFKAVMKRNAEKELWSYASEWNRSYRVIAAWGDESLVHEFTTQLRAPKMLPLNANMRMRPESALPAADDEMFLRPKGLEIQ